MEKKALRTDWGTVGRFATGGAITGASTAALLNLVHMLREQRKEQVARNTEADTDRDTIVVTLPPKAASLIKRFEGPMAKATRKDDNANAGGRDVRGRYDNPRSLRVTDSEGKIVKSATGWPTMTMSALAAVGGLGVGAAIVDKLYQMRREKLLTAELDAAQQQYLTALGGQDKAGSALDTLFPIEKQADSSSAFGLLNFPLAAAALLTLMGTGGTAYITKRILDEKMREARETGMDLPKVKRIVFRTAPTQALPAGVPGEETKEASAAELLSVKAALFIMMDKLDTHTRVLGTPGVKEAQVAAGLSTSKLFNLSEGDIGVIMDMLNNHPELARKIVEAGMSRRPIMKHFKWLAKTAPGLSIGKSVIKNKLESLAGPAPMIPKQADLANTAVAMMAGNLVGSALAEDATKELLTKKEKPVAAEPVADNGAKRIDLSKVTVSAEDPQAEAYLKANRDKVIKVLQLLADQGKI